MDYAKFSYSHSNSPCWNFIRFLNKSLLSYSLGVKFFPLLFWQWCDLWVRCVPLLWCSWFIEAHAVHITKRDIIYLHVRWDIIILFKYFLSDSFSCGDFSLIPDFEIRLAPCLAPAEWTRGEGWPGGPYTRHPSRGLKGKLNAWGGSKPVPPWREGTTCILQPLTWCFEMHAFKNVKPHKGHP